MWVQAVWKGGKSSRGAAVLISFRWRPFLSLSRGASTMSQCQHSIGRPLQIAGVATTCTSLRTVGPFASHRFNRSKQSAVIDAVLGRASHGRSSATGA